MKVQMPKKFSDLTPRMMLFLFATAVVIVAYLIQWYTWDMIVDAIESEDLEKLDELNKYPFLLSFPNMFDGRSVTHVAARGKLHVLKYLVEDLELRLDTKDTSGETPLHVAAAVGNLRVLRYILLHPTFGQVDPTDIVGHTPLHIAAELGHIDIAEYLITKGADVERRDLMGCTPLHTAAHNGQEDMVVYLINNEKADYTVQDTLGNNIMHNACKSGHILVTNALFGIHDFPILDHNKFGMTAVPMCLQELTRLGVADDGEPIRMLREASLLRMSYYIEEYLMTTLESLDLSNMYMEDLPGWVYSLGNLKELDLQENPRLRGLNRKLMSQMTSLETIKFRGTGMSANDPPYGFVYGRSGHFVRRWNA
eukprot:GFYU01006238.1.p1 GENE.GFYU01006238.1~~GFYU01006238.1.p1  ORF type:complete len:367 (-),score=36.25 GFYU01006238.1:178-1278(-)